MTAANENIITTIGVEITEFMKNRMSRVGQEELKLPFHVLPKCGNYREDFLTWSLISTSQKDGVEFVHVPRVMDHRMFEIAQVCWYQKNRARKKSSLQKTVQVHSQNQSFYCKNLNGNSANMKGK